MRCPVCGGETDFFCGKSWKLRKIDDHYLISYRQLNKVPKKGCPICGEPMKKLGKAKKRVSRYKEVEVGPERMYCWEKDHLLIVTEMWYREKGREIIMSVSEH